MSHSPTDRSALIELVSQFHQDATPWIPSGLGQHLEWGPDLDPSHAVLSCRHLDRVIDHAVDDLTLTVEAGMPLDSLQALLADQGQWLPVDLPRDGNAGSIGGVVARGLAGGLRQRHLGVRDQIIGIGLLRADGVEARAGGRVVKNVAGYDLMRLLCGSWGSLALITDVTLRVQPVRPHQAALVLDGAMSDLESGRAELLRSTLTPERCDWQGSVDQGLQLKVTVTSVSEAAVEEQLQRLKQLGQSHGLTSEQQPCSDQRDNRLTCSAPTWLVRVVLPPAKVSQLLQGPEISALTDWTWDIAAGAGCGDGWSSGPSEAFKVDALRRRVIEHGGALTVLVQPQSATIPAWLDTPARPVIEAVKRQFDPRQQLCRGRLPGVNQETA